MESVEINGQDSFEENLENCFENLELNKNLLKGVYVYGFKKPSKIQVEGIKAINTGKDCILQSQSGTGKTATYFLSLILKKGLYIHLKVTILSFLLSFLCKAKLTFRTEMTYLT